MKKNVNLKIVIIFFVIGIILILGLGACYIFMLNQIENSNQTNQELLQFVGEQMNQTKLIIIISIVIYTIISALIGYFVLKTVVSPMKKLIKSVEKIASGENIKLDEDIQNIGAVGDIENAFSIVTNELNQKDKKSK